MVSGTSSANDDCHTLQHVLLLDEARQVSQAWLVGLSFMRLGHFNSIRGILYQAVLVFAFSDHEPRQLLLLEGQQALPLLLEVLPLRHGRVEDSQEPLLKVWRDVDELAVEVLLLLGEGLPLEIRIVAADLAQAEGVKLRGVLVDQLVRPIEVLGVPKDLLEIVSELQGVVDVIVLLKSLEDQVEAHRVLDLAEIGLLGRRVVLLPELVREEAVLVLSLDVRHDLLDVFHSPLLPAVWAAILQAWLDCLAERALPLTLDQLLLHRVVRQDQVALHVDPQVAGEALDHVRLEELLLAWLLIGIDGWPVLEADFAELG